jgi:hypothetical protein
MHRFPQIHLFEASLGRIRPSSGSRHDLLGAGTETLLALRCEAMCESPRRSQLHKKSFGLSMWRAQASLAPYLRLSAAQGRGLNEASCLKGGKGNQPLRIPLTPSLLYLDKPSNTCSHVRGSKRCSTLSNISTDFRLPSSTLHHICMITIIWTRSHSRNRASLYSSVLNERVPPPPPFLPPPNP